MEERTHSPKARLRRELDTRRRAVATSDVVRPSLAACGRAFDLVALRTAPRMVLYAPRVGELDPTRIASARGDTVTTYYPRVEAEELRFHRAKPSELSPGSFGIPEPSRDAPELPGEAAGVLVLVPGLGFDRRGGRLGTGRGYYDRALGRYANAVRVGFVLDDFLLDALPTDAWDVAMHAIVTDRRVVVIDGRVMNDHSGESSWI